MNTNTIYEIDMVLLDRIMNDIFQACQRAPCTPQQVSAQLRVRERAGSFEFYINLISNVSKTSTICIYAFQKYTPQNQSLGELLSHKMKILLAVN